MDNVIIILFGLLFYGLCLAGGYGMDALFFYPYDTKHSIVVRNGLRNVLYLKYKKHNNICLRSAYYLEITGYFILLSSAISTITLYIMNYELNSNNRIITFIIFVLYGALTLYIAGYACYYETKYKNKKYFIIELKSDKKLSEGFGLLPTDNADVFILSSEKSLWKKRLLYDFGKGKENGYYRLPQLKYDDLVNLILRSNCFDNIYGAASIILEDYSDDLLNTCRTILNDKKDVKNYLKLFQVLQLIDSPNKFGNKDDWKEIFNKLKIYICDEKTI